MIDEVRRAHLANVRTAGHIIYEHHGQLPPGFRKRGDITWDQVHHLLHRLFRWKNWSHTYTRNRGRCATCKARWQALHDLRWQKS